MLQELLGQIEVGFRPSRANVVQVNRFSVARRLTQADVARNHRAIDTITEELPHFLNHLAGQIGAVVVHRQQHAFDSEVGIEGSSHPLDGLHELTDSLECQVFALQRDQHRVRGYKGVQSEETQRRRAVDEDVVIEFTDFFDLALQYEFTTVPVDHIYFGTDQAAVGRNHSEIGEFLGLQLDIVQRGVPDQRLVERSALGILRVPESPRGVRLGIGVDEERGALGNGQGGGEVDRGRGLADASLLVCDRDDPTQWSLSS